MISIVVPNHNRDLSLLRNAIAESSYKDVELIEINRGMERSKQRNIGIREAKGDIILWLDSDQTIHPELLKEAHYLFQTGVRALYVPEIIVGRSFFSRIRAFERWFYTGTAVDVPRFVLRPYMPFFDESLHGPEDADVGQRIKGLKLTTKHPLYHHDDINIIDYIRKKMYYSKSMARYKEKWPLDKCLNWKWRCFGVFFENGKYKKVIKHPFLFICIMLLIFVRGVAYNYVLFSQRTKKKK
jgi:glycosyltransferase involved in cell wall biosynthesis